MRLLSVLREPRRSITLGNASLRSLNPPLTAYAPTLDPPTYATRAPEAGKKAIPPLTPRLSQFFEIRTQMMRSRVLFSLYPECPTASEWKSLYKLRSLRNMVLCHLIVHSLASTIRACRLLIYHSSSSLLLLDKYMLPASQLLLSHSTLSLSARMRRQ
jgi:hypothetical protein